MASTGNARSLVASTIVDNVSQLVSAALMRNALNVICDVADSLNAENTIGIGQVDDQTVEVRTPINTPTSADWFMLVQYAHYPRTINEVRLQAVRATATFLATFYINDTAITGLSNLPVTPTSRTVANIATANNSLLVGSRLRLQLSSVTGQPFGFSATVKSTRT